MALARIGACRAIVAIIPLLVLFFALFSSLAGIGSGIGLNRRALQSNWCNFPPPTKHPLSLCKTLYNVQVQLKDYTAYQQLLYTPLSLSLQSIVQLKDCTAIQQQEFTAIPPMDTNHLWPFSPSLITQSVFELAAVKASL